MSESQTDILARLETKLKGIGQDPDVHLEGLVWSKPITYWDYIHTDALLSLQIQRSTLPDELVFIVCHQINELLFKMILWEIDQIATSEQLDVSVFTDKLQRISRCFDVLAASFSIMEHGMETEQYLKFRNTLTPASGFQSAQYRLIEFGSTEVINLIDARYRETIGQPGYNVLYDNLYWQAAGTDHKTGKKSTLINLFEERYKSDFLKAMQRYSKTNLWTKYKSLPEQDRSNEILIAAMRHYDRTVNITWVMAHYHAAEKYLESNGKAAEGTGGSNWKKYMHPRYQRRIFFPGLWTADELANWGTDV